ncbi:lytic murein transglycosylase [Salinimonas sediminis]|uniref:Lytic murein transglycosylase n=1 Tax=Salinimonas sediminis TaxID=2303538 RepID=A0A346NHZ9_9ALTE|nr:lytic murein transglycosylase [Salinimonas sediminis]AXR05156.1 lytic murein transglycosylase [Salinimonas sediminis]
MKRFCNVISGLAVATFFLGASAQAAEDFAQCKDRLSTQAIAAGVDEAVVNKAFASVSFVPRVIELDRSQPEFVTTFPSYYSKRVTSWRIDKGREMLQQHASLLNELEAKYGIPPHYLVAFWGLETNFGSYKGTMPVLSSLATLACDQRRSDYFTGELMTALKLMQREQLSPEAMVGSWAGAMGHTQFMPTAYYRYAVDGDGDGLANLWESEPDALTSAANFLDNLGWEPGFRWGREIQLPKGFDYRQTGYQNRQSLTQWQQLGLTQANGNPLPDSDLTAYVVVPAGHKGPAFLAYHNFRVIMRWNNSEFYAIAVGELANQLAGAKGLVASLPDLPAYSRDNIIDLQKTLNQEGFDVGKPDGILGPATRAGIREFQLANELIADGFPGEDVMRKLGVELTAGEKS